MMADPEHGNRDEAESVDEDAYEDGIAVRERLNRLTRDVRDGEAQPKDRHDGSKDAVRKRFDPRLPESRDGAALRAHGFAKPSLPRAISSAHPPRARERLSGAG